MIALLGALQNELCGVAEAMLVEWQVAGKPWQITRGRFAGEDILLVNRIPY